MSFQSRSVSKRYLHKVAMQKKYPCRCVTKQGARCGGIAAHKVDVLMRTTTAYRHDALPKQYEGAGFLATTLLVCSTHQAVLNRGGAVCSWVEYIPPVVQPTLPMVTDEEKEAYENRGCECEIDYNCHLHQGGYSALELMNDAHTEKDPIHTEDYYNGDEGVPTHNKPKGILCGKCRKKGVPHPYHETPMQVRICYLKKF